jgi:23S rRNA (adenine2503-C2)-methyltransferase
MYVTYLYRLADLQLAQKVSPIIISVFPAVYIPETSRGTLCISSQVGCTFACTFCHTGTQGLQRNLRPSELVAQLLTAKKLLFDFGNQEGRAISNLVFMGQGEPFYNYRNLKKALDIITDPKGLAMSKRKITVSTSGVVPNIEKLGTDFPGMGLAISLHAADDKLRSEIVTANRQWPLAELINACKNYPSLSPNNRITFEYVSTALDRAQVCCSTSLTFSLFSIC